MQCSGIPESDVAGIDEHFDKPQTPKQKSDIRVTPQQIQDLMDRVTYRTGPQMEGTTSTFVHAYLDGNFYLATGYSACVDPVNFDPAMGRDIAMRKARNLGADKLWELEGYRLYASVTQ